MALDRTQLIVGIGLLVAGSLSFALNTWAPLWDKLAVPPEERGQLNIALSIFALLLANWIGVYQLMNQTMERVNRSLERWNASQPRLPVFEVMSGNEAFLYLARQIQGAKTVLNTRIAPPNMPAGYSTAAGKSWEKAVEASIRNGTIFRDVVSDCWEPLARGLYRRVLASDGTYQFANLGPVTPPFLNFVIVDKAREHSEVLFGWAISPQNWDQPCFKTEEGRIVGYFRELHAELFRAGHEQKLGTEGRSRVRIRDVATRALTGLRRLRSRWTSRAGGRDWPEVDAR